MGLIKNLFEFGVQQTEDILRDGIRSFEDMVSAGKTDNNATGGNTYRYSSNGEAGGGATGSYTYDRSSNGKAGGATGSYTYDRSSNGEAGGGASGSYTYDRSSNGKAGGGATGSYTYDRSSNGKAGGGTSGSYSYYNSSNSNRYEKTTTGSYSAYSGKRKRRKRNGRRNGYGSELYVLDHRSSGRDIIIIIISAFFLFGFLVDIPVIINEIFNSAGSNMVMWGGLVFSSALAILFIVVIFKRRANMKFKKRYERYVDVLRFRNMVLIDDLAIISGLKADRVVSDLKKAVKDELIPQGHFAKDDLFFIVSNDEYLKYKAKQSYYDRYFRKVVEERYRMRDRSKEMQTILDKGYAFIDKTRVCRDIAGNMIVSQKLDRMGKLVSTIFHEVDADPSKGVRIGMLIDYYIPTTEKLLDSYIEIEEKQATGPKIENTKKHLEEAFDKVNILFESTLDKMYQEKEIDLDAEISAMEILMKQEGFFK